MELNGDLRRINIFSELASYIINIMIDKRGREAVIVYSIIYILAWSRSG